MTLALQRRRGKHVQQRYEVEQLVKGEAVSQLELADRTAGTTRHFMSNTAP